MQFKNPMNGYQEEVSKAGLWVFLFGFFYFAVKGVWTHAIVGAILAVFTLGLSWLIYPFYAESIMRSYYLKKGWTEVDSAGSSGPVVSSTQNPQRADASWDPGI